MCQTMSSLFLSTLENFGAHIYKLIVQIAAILLEDTNQIETQPGSQCLLGHKLQ